MLRIAADALSTAIRVGSAYCRLLYPYCVCGFPSRSAAIRSPILKVISCFTYAADAADKVSPYWLRRPNYGADLRRVCLESTDTVQRQYAHGTYIYSTEIRA